MANQIRRVAPSGCRSHIASTSFRRMRHCDPNFTAGSSSLLHNLRIVVLEIPTNSPLPGCP